MDEGMLDYVVRRLREEGPQQWPEIARAAEKPASTLHKIAYRYRKNPRIETLEPIANVLRKREQPH